MPEVLPPRLMLPTAADPTEQFKREYMHQNGHDYETIISFGAFATALNVYASPITGRVSFMPTQDDLKALYECGYGLGHNLLAKKYGGLTSLQQALGFYSWTAQPEVPEVVDRLKWLATHVFTTDGQTPDGKSLHIRNIVEWASVRHLLPSRNYIYKIFGEQTAPIFHKIFATERPNAPKNYSMRDLYRFGAKVVREHETPPDICTLNQFCREEFFGQPQGVIRALVGKPIKLWSEFGFYTASKGMTDAELIDAGIKLAIQHGRVLSGYEMGKLSILERSPSDSTISKKFGSIPAYQVKIQELLDSYYEVKQKLQEAEVADELIQLIGKNFTSDRTYVQKVILQIPSLKKLSADKHDIRVIKKLIISGFDLQSDDNYRDQLQDFVEVLAALDIRDRTTRFLLGLMPFTDPDETLEDISKL